MKIAFASDLHIEFHAEFPAECLRFPADSDVIVLAGDIDVGPSAVQTVRRIADLNPNATVLWVAGNHEFYKSNIDEQVASYRKAFAHDPRIHFLENDHLTLNGTNFLGCTLWTDFSVLGAAKQTDAMQAARKLPDFRIIEKDGARFTPDAACRLFHGSLDYLEAKLKDVNPSKTVVITHFSPGLETHNKKFEVDLLAAYFQANVFPLIQKHTPAFWIYGHNHFNEDLTIGKTQLVSNQLGYPAEDCGGVFNPEKMLEI